MAASLERDDFSSSRHSALASCWSISSGNPFPYIKDSSTGLPCSASDTRGCFQDGGVLGRIPANRIYAPGLAALNIFPSPNFSGGSGLNFTSGFAGVLNVRSSWMTGTSARVPGL